MTRRPSDWYESFQIQKTKNTVKQREDTQPLRVPVLVTCLSTALSTYCSASKASTLDLVSKHLVCGGPTAVGRTPAFGALLISGLSCPGRRFFFYVGPV